MSEINTHRLPNGLRVLHITTTSHVGWCGVAVNAGSRDEASGQFGLAHFVEHTIFKGTTHRKAWHILNRMEKVGGELNAYTTKESTVLYSVFPEQSLQRAVELLADLVQCSIFPPHELQRELDVVLEESQSYRDSPADAIFDDFDDIIFAGNELGHNILGVERDLRRLTQADCLRWLRTFYVPDNMIFFVAAPTAPSKTFRLVERYFSAMPQGEPHRRRATPPAVKPAVQTVSIGSHQAHTIVGARTTSMFSDQRFALSLLNNVLAGPGMNSLLNVRMRERRGLVYTVESSLVPLTDCGLLEIYFGCDKANVGTSLKIIVRTVAELADHGLTPTQLAAAKKQLCGQMLVASDNSESCVMSAAKSFLYQNTVMPLQAAIERIQAITTDDLRSAAAAVTPDKWTTLHYV